MDGEDLLQKELRTANLTQGYGRTLVFESLNLNIRPGVVGLLGPNGAGKTTLLRTLATVSRPVAGEIELGSKPLKSTRDIRSARREIGYLPQSFGYFGGFTVCEFVEYCAWLRAMSARRARQATKDAVHQVGLWDKRKEKMKRLSGGMLRRAGIASALVGSPDYIFLDEPTVGLDPEQRVQFREVLREATDGVVLLSTHLTEDVAAVCDQAIVFSKGSVRFDGSPEELQARGAEGRQKGAAAGGSDLERGYLSYIGAGGDG